MRVPVQRKLDAGAALRDRLKAAGDGLGSQVVADLVGSLRASHQNSSALFAELKEARAIMADVQRSTQGPSLDGRISAFLARNGKGEG